jgi:siderophore synthetase component
VLRAPVGGPLPFRRVEIIGSPWIAAAGRPRPLRTTGAFLSALERALHGSEYAEVFCALRSDFENSVANVVLNRLIGSALPKRSKAIEPAYQGHQYYPLPALRIGPSVSDVIACSHLSERPVDLPLLEIDGCRLVTGAFKSYESFMRAWSGLELDPASDTLLPVHPWQLALSPVVRELLARKHAVRSARSLKMMPLASQRTCRIVTTGYDVKLPVDATLTGERRLLYRLNCENAPAISALAARLRGEKGWRTIDFQADVAAIFHAHPALASHLSAIIRSPVRPQPGESVMPAINLWTGRREWRALLRSAGPVRLEEFFDRYCRALMTGPVQFCTQSGIAFEPHVQNVYIAFRDGVPSRVILRDLDASVLDPRRVRPALRRLGLEVAKDTWEHMPAFEIGGRRLVQAMLFGHVGEVISCLTESRKVTGEKLVGIVEDVWSDLIASAPSTPARKAVKELRGWSNAVKATLHTRLHRSTSMEFVRE